MLWSHDGRSRMKALKRRRASVNKRTTPSFMFSPAQRSVLHLVVARSNVAPIPNNMDESKVTFQHFHKKRPVAADTTASSLTLYLSALCDGSLSKQHHYGHAQTPARTILLIICRYILYASQLHTQSINPNPAKCASVAQQFYLTGCDLRTSSKWNVATSTPSDSFGSSSAWIFLPRHLRPSG